jgi:hypothetical protein
VNARSSVAMATGTPKNRSIVCIPLRKGDAIGIVYPLSTRAPERAPIRRPLLGASNQYVERLTKPGNMAQPALDVLDREHRGMLVQQEAEQRPLGEVRDRSCSEPTRTRVRIPAVVGPVPPPYGDRVSIPGPSPLEGSARCRQRTGTADGPR